MLHTNVLLFWDHRSEVFQMQLSVWIVRLFIFIWISSWLRCQWINRGMWLVFIGSCHRHQLRIIPRVKLGLFSWQQCWSWLICLRKFLYFYNFFEADAWWLRRFLFYLWRSSLLEWNWGIIFFTFSFATVRRLFCLLINLIIFLDVKFENSLTRMILSKGYLIGID